MSLIKGFILELDDERIEWIKTQLGDPDADESTVGWSDYEAKFYEHRFSQTTEEEFVWFSNQTSDSLHDKFRTEINMLRDIISHDNIAAGLEEPIYKMAYAHAVTLLETFLSDTVKSLIVNNDDYFKNALNNVDEFKKAKFLLVDVWKHPEGVKGWRLKPSQRSFITTFQRLN